MISFLLIDDHELLRLGIRFALEEAFPDARTLEAGSLASGLVCLQGTPRPNLVLLDPDLSIAGGGGISALQAIHLACPGLPVVIVSGAADHKFINRCFALGACGFVAKSFGSAQVVACVQTVLAGAIYRPDMSGVCASRLRESLTRREEEIALFCAAGLRNKEIGQRLGISDNTVRVHLVKIFKRFDLTSRSDVKALVKRMGLGEANPIFVAGDSSPSSRPDQNAANAHHKTKQ